MTTNVADSTIAAQRQRLAESADEITTLRDRVAALEGALQPFAIIDPSTGGPASATGDDYRNARSILSRAQQGGGDGRQ